MALVLTEKAAQQVLKFKQENSLSEDAFLRIGISAGGCSGFSYEITFDDSFDATKDSRYEQYGVSMVVDKKSSILLDGTHVDWHESFDKRGFTFENPNAVKSCGCGSSFQV